MRYFSKIGTSICQMHDGDMPDNCDVEMSGYKTHDHCISSASGEWIEGKSQDQINQESREYLASTDWHVIRKQETEEAMPEEISTLRAQARLAISDEE
tara:strand:- start:4064 stop:4357 length:294 start_codon:yes stop_codon:yes gene_type:complete